MRVADQVLRFGNHSLNTRIISACASGVPRSVTGNCDTGNCDTGTGGWETIDAATW